MRWVVTPLAEQDMEEIGDYISRENPRRAIAFVSELRTQCRKIASSPQIYRFRKELGDNIQSCVYGNYVIFFQHVGQVVRIVRILHGARDIETQFAS